METYKSRSCKYQKCIQMMFPTSPKMKMVKKNLKCSETAKMVISNLINNSSANLVWVDNNGESESVDVSDNEKTLIVFLLV